MISVRISSQDLDRTVVLRQLSSESHVICFNHPISLMVLLDLSDAFDTIDHNILLNRLQNYVGISKTALAWCKSLLSDRYQCVAANEEMSYPSQVQYGVPQGSVLGPLLFTSYTHTHTHINTHTLHATLRRYHQEAWHSFSLLC